MRLKNAPRALLASATLACALVACRPAPAPEPLPETTRELRDGWRLASSAEVAAGGAEISRPGFDASGWTAATVPTTVLAALVASGEIEDPYFNKNLERIPVERFAVPWWYRTTFDAGQALPAGTRLVLDGLNYRADVWLNGRQVADRDRVAGAFRVFGLDLAGRLTPGVNALAIEVHPPQPGEPTIGFVDWNPEPPDRNMGLWRGVHLRLTGDAAVDDVAVTSEVDLESLARASLTVRATLSNHADRAIAVELAGTIRPESSGEAGDAPGDAPIEFIHQLVLAPGEAREVELSPAELPQLAIDDPRLWWPHDLGEPDLYELELIARAGGEVSDHAHVTFGIRQVADYLSGDGHRGYEINGKRILIRGGGWVDDLMLADDDRKVEDQIRYARHLGLNTLRLEGFWGSSHRLFDLADRYGLLVMVGWSCQWEWQEYLGGPVDEFGGIDTPAEQELVARSLRDQVVWLRNHPSVFLWVLASDMLPRPELERRYLAQLAEVDATRPALAACSTRTSEVSGPTGVKMNGPYDYVPPSYWYQDTERGGAFGFNTETGPGPQPPPVESIRRMLPEEHWWPIDDMWHYHCGRHQFNTLGRFRRALDARYGESTGLEDFAAKSQLASYEAMRAMFEAFSARRGAATGVVQWMLNSAWPEMYWQLYDHYLVPNGAFYGARVANRPRHLIYDYGDRGLIAVNDAESTLGGMVRVRVFDTRSEVLLDESRPIEVAAGERLRVLTLPDITPEVDPAYFVDARIEGNSGQVLASNFYWLSAQEDVLDWDASEWFVTPISRYADLTAVTRLAPAAVEVEHRFEPTESGHAIDVRLSNTGDRLAFFIELKVVGVDSGRLAAPILWDDNYVSLLTGETRHLRGTFPAHALAGEAPVFRYSGMNVE